MFSMFSQNRQLKEETEMKKPLSSITEEQFQDIKTAILYSDEMINLFRHNTPDGKAKKKRKICWDYKERIWAAGDIYTLQSAVNNDLVHPYDPSISLKKQTGPLPSTTKALVGKYLICLIGSSRKL